jgi:uncharacterized protein (DUF2141 family)
MSGAPGLQVLIFNMFAKSPKAARTRVVRRLALALLGIVLLGTPSAGAGGDAEITVPISTVRNGNGTVFVALYERRNWLEPGRYLTATKVKAERGTVYAKFRNLPRGRYGVAVFHDENANNRVDTNLVGLPAEGYGFSRVSPLRKPKFEEIYVSAEPRAYAPIRLRY